MIIVEVLGENPSEVALVEHDELVEALAMDRSDESLDVRRGLRRQLHPMALNHRDVGWLRIPSIHCTGASLRW